MYGGEEYVNRCARSYECKVLDGEPRPFHFCCIFSWGVKFVEWDRRGWIFAGTVGNTLVCAVRPSIKKLTILSKLVHTPIGPAGNGTALQCFI